MRHSRIAVLFTATVLSSGGAAAQAAVARADTAVRRTHAIEYSDFYYTRLKIHKIGAITMLPLLAGEYALGDNLLRVADPPGWVKGTHGAVAGSLAVVAGINTVTGAWNLWDSRHDTHGRLRKYLHVALLVGSDVGFAWAGASADGAHDSPAAAKHHRDIALGAIGLDVAGTVMMWLWKD